MRCACMPMFLITVVNDTFTVQNEEEHPDADAAMEQGIKGALAVGSEQVLTGGPSFFGAEVTVSNGNDRQRFVVSVGVSPLK